MGNTLEFAFKVTVDFMPAEPDAAEEDATAGFAAKASGLGNGMNRAWPPYRSSRRAPREREAICAELEALYPAPQPCVLGLGQADGATSGASSRIG